MALKKPSDLFSNKSGDNNIPIIESDSSFREELIKVESLSEQVIQLQQELSQKVIKSDLESLVLSQINTMQENFEHLQNDFRKSNKKDTTEFKQRVSELAEIVSNLVENELPKYKKQVTGNEVRIGDKFDELKEVVEENIVGIREEIDSKVNNIAEVIDNNIDNIGEDVDTFKNQVSTDISSIKADVVISEQHIKNIDKYLQEHHQELVELKEEVFDEIEKLSVGNLQENLERLEKKIDYINETYSKIEPEVIVKEVIKEGLLNEPPDTKNSDPLTALDQKFVTLDQLQEHYRLFINRIQQQLSTLGGGGETKLRYLDDVVGIATNASAYDGKYLQWNSSTNKAEFTTVTGGEGSGDYATSAGISTYATSSGIATYATNAGISTNLKGGSGGSLPYQSSSGITSFLANGSSGEILQSNGTTLAPSWASPQGLTIGYANTAGIATYATTAGYATTSGISTTSQGLTGTPNIYVGIITATSYNGSGSNLTGIVTYITAGSGISVNQNSGNVTITTVGSSEGSWTVSAGAGTYSFTVPANANYVMWMRGNIPNGICIWNATVSISNTNVPVIGNQYGWYYTDGNQLVLTAIPSQIIGTSGSIITSSPAVSNTNTFSFGITNNSGTNQTVFYGYRTI